MACDDQSGLFKQVESGKRYKVLQVRKPSRNDSFKL